MTSRLQADDNSVILRRISRSAGLSGWFRHQRQFSPLYPPSLPPELPADAISGINHDVAFGNADGLEPGKAARNQGPSNAFPPRRRRDREVVNEPAPSVVPAKRGAYDLAVSFGDETQTGIAEEEGADAFARIRISQPQPLTRTPQLCGLAMVARREPSDLGFHKGSESQVGKQTRQANRLPRDAFMSNVAYAFSDGMRIP